MDAVGRMDGVAAAEGGKSVGRGGCIRHSLQVRLAKPA
jgi:hypothetical protein